MTPFAPVPLLFLHPIDSELQAFLQEAHALLANAPQLLVRAEADLDAHGCGKKALRLADATWQAQRTELLPGKGHALTAQTAWDSDDYILARDQRSAIESLMFTLKQGFHFGEVARRGLDAVYGELLEKGLAYNLCRLARFRRAALAQTKRYGEPLRAAA